MNYRQTYTMLGESAGPPPGEGGPGLITLAIEDVLRGVGEHSKDRTFKIRLSCLEIYNEMVNDLLAPERANLKLYERSGGVLVSGLSECVQLTLTLPPVAAWPICCAHMPARQLPSRAARTAPRCAVYRYDFGLTDLTADAEALAVLLRAAEGQRCQDSIEPDAASR